MTSKTIYEIITFLCCFVCAASVQGQGKFLFGKDTDWNLARKACEDNQTRLPNVKLSESGIQLADIFHWGPNECFWIGATYERITNYTYGSFPTVCCGTVERKHGNLVRACDNCEAIEQFICESGPNTVVASKLQVAFLSWINASKECSNMGLQLPSLSNTNFRRSVRAAVWWINEVRILNLSQLDAKNGDIPLCFCDARSPNFQCPANVETYCMPYARTDNNTSGILHTSMPSTDTYSTRPISTVTIINSGSNINATSSVQPGSKRTLDLFSANMYATVPSISLTNNFENGFAPLSHCEESLNGKSHSTPEIDTRFQSVPPATIVNTETKGNVTLVGSLIGAAVAVIFILTLGMIVIVRRIRTKRREADDNHYQTQVIARSNKKVQTQTNSSYGIVFDNTLDMDSRSTALSRTPTVLQEPELHAQPQIVKRISINNKNGHKCVDNKELPLYSMAHKGQIKKDTAEVIEQCYDNNKDYDKIEFEKRYVNESSGDMYDKAKMHGQELYKKKDTNLYNRTGFSCTAFDKNECNVYDNENCSRIENSHDNITQEDNGFIEGTYDHVEC